MRRQFGAVSTAVMFWSIASPLFAQTFKVGDLVVVKEDAVLTQSGKKVDYVWPGLTLKVQADKGTTVQVSNGTPGELDKKKVVAWGSGDAAGKEALQVLSDLIKKYPNDPRPLCGRADVWRHLGDTGAALKDCEAAINLRQAADFYSMKATVLYENKQLDQAVSTYKDAITKSIRNNSSTQNARLYNNLGLARMRQWQARDFTKLTAAERVTMSNDFTQCLGDFSEAIRLAPNYANAYFNRGNAYLAKGQMTTSNSTSDDLAKAVQDYSNAISRDENHALAYANRGLARLVASQGVASLQGPVLQDLRTALEKGALTNDRAQLFCCVAGRISARYANDAVNADYFKSKAAAIPGWPSEIMSYLETGNETALVQATVGDNDKATEAKFYVVLNQPAANAKVNSEYLENVVQFGTPAFIETWLAGYIKSHLSEFPAQSP